MQGKIARPALCRLCHFPVGMDGVRMSDVDIVKLSRWWKKTLVTDFEDEELESKFFCQFCLCNAKLQDEKIGTDCCDWWTGHDTNKFYKKFYFDEQVIQPCRVALTLLPEEEIQNEPSTSWESRRTVIETACVYCSKVFKSRRAAFQHVVHAHKNVETFWCKDCSLHFKSHWQKDKHYEQVHSIHGKVRCHMCLKKIAGSVLVKHITQNHAESDNEYFECCKRNYSGTDQLAIHMRLKIVYKMVKCVYCKSTWTINSLPGHVSQCHSSRAIKCQYKLCGIYFLTEKEKQEHVTKVHESKKGLIQCIYCERKFTPVNLSRHTLLVHKDEAIKCSFSERCPEYFLSEEKRQQHESEFHVAPKLVPTTWKCIRCDKICTTKRGLKSHYQNNHHNFEPKFCKGKKCSENFSSDEELQSHFLEKHSAEEEKKKFQCGQCSFRSHKLEYIKRHTEIKHGTEQIRCQKCPKVFKSSSALHHHMYYHVEKKKCPHCSVAVVVLNQHLLVPPCPECKKVLPCSSLRKRHLENCKV